ncbi:MAG: hypothetical protein GWN61_18495 [candidate division Zixibacteria bacterium]|nr:nuclear transport factor 2 family protein [candidate division Zixibacteria bacterium]NIS47844.1 nuclear transport factor 2 family protein [candidate division Zixibacteria bacterium]NIU15944.1 nuclear transport factor 2 family protein [candidate division Zixibacteria bacterium]NIV08109.1 hypothetical protein [candidate division Zixibacteria bacterium]NIW47356.1 hypothetical protein [Gammaproteobacteria bacterium]
MTIGGKGYYLWKIRECEGGDVNAIAHAAREAGLTHILIKIADGIYSYNYDWVEQVDLVPPLVVALRTQGISPWGWHYVYGDQPIQEAQKAIERVTDLQLDGYVIDAESEYKEPGKDAAARTFMSYLKSGIPDTPLALSSYRYPTYHPQLPWDEFLSVVDYNMPQVYWLLAHNPGEQLNRCIREFAALPYNPPIIPTGAAYTEYGWAPTSAEIIEFLQTARALELQGANFWEWSNTRKYLPEIWETIKEYPWETGYVPPTDITGLYIEALNIGNPEYIISLYSETAVHVSAARTIQGKDSLQAWYTTFLNQLLPNGTFILTGYSGTGNSRHFTWNATTDRGNVLNGNDTFGLYNGLITYHYTYFTIT